ncbi:22211_t:CDS:1, partial [Cetraspora pellucida]
LPIDLLLLGHFILAAVYVTCNCLTITMSNEQVNILKTLTINVNDNITQDNNNTNI